MKKVKNLIIGAGISGLTYANYSNDYLIVEKESEVGGYCRTIKQDDFVWDYAGHFFHFNTDEFRKKFLEELPKAAICRCALLNCLNEYYSDLWKEVFSEDFKYHDFAI